MKIRLLMASVAITWAVGATAQEPQPDPLAAGFRDPPQSARPRVWWHWLNGNITTAGIDKDLEWMKRVGIGGVQTFDASLGTPQVVKDRLVYMTPPWKAAFAHAAITANRLGLELAISSSPGWSETGGPWVTPDDGMKKLVWTQTDVAGGKPFKGKLTPPPSATGPYGFARYFDPLSSLGAEAAQATPSASGDVRVLAYPLVAIATANPKATNQSGASVDDAVLVDADENTTVKIPLGSPAAPPSITLTYPGAIMARSVTLFVPGAVPPFGDPIFLGTLEAENSGRWTTVATLPLGNVPITVAIPPVSASRFRLVFGPNTAPKRAGDAPPAPGAIMAGPFPGAASNAALEIGTFRLSPEAMVDRFEAKAGFATVNDYYALDTETPAPSAIDPARVIDLTGRLRTDGSLDWTPPAGDWRVLRLGWSLLGTTNHPASPEATGLEVDKYDGSAVRRYLSKYLDTYRTQIDDKGISGLLTDSIESGNANWTPQMLGQFRQLRGYDATPWLPALTGQVIGSRAKSDAFLYDYRRTLADLIASQHYGTIATMAHENGLRLYGEALEDGRPQLGDDMAMRAHTDIPMAAMWAFGKNGAPRSTFVGDILGAASIAHVYGQNLVAAESFTAAFSPWAFAPADLRHVADLEFALGVNRPVIHTSVHSPMEDKEPGLSLAIFGQYFNRHETWGEMARPWVDYLARSSFLLQQGRHVADIAYFYGEEAPLTALYAQTVLPDVPVGRGYDFINANALVDQLSVSGGELVSKGGSRYRLLYLGGSSQRMTLPTLRRIAALVEKGATVVGEAPLSSPSLDDPVEFRTLVRKLWPGTPETKIALGRVVADRGADVAALRAGLVRDFTFTGQDAASVMFQHRALDNGDVYFLDNRATSGLAFEARFRVTGKVPEIWHADTGKTEKVSYRVEGGQTIIPLNMAAEDSLFVIFRQSTTDKVKTVTPSTIRTIATLDRPWNVTFQSGRGAPAATRLPRLTSLSAQSDPAIRYFSGVTTYRSRFVLPHQSGSLMLDLGKIGDVAEVRINGQLAGTVWHAPYRVDLGTAAHRGENDIEVRVANVWVNRLIGDAQPGAAKITFVVAPTYRPDAPLRPSGLIGPVTILSEKQD
jgi:hypothetical protein